MKKLTVNANIWQVVSGRKENQKDVDKCSSDSLPLLTGSKQHLVSENVLLLKYSHSGSEMQK